MLFVGSGIITKEELSSFYSSVLGLDKKHLEEILENAYKAMTSVSCSNFVIATECYVF